MRRASPEYGADHAQFDPLSLQVGDLSSRDLFVRSQGDPRAASSQERNAVRSRAYFRRERTAMAAPFLQSRRREHPVLPFLWVQQQRERSNVIELVDTLWQRTTGHDPRFRNKLTWQGEILLSCRRWRRKSLTSGKQRTLLRQFHDRRRRSRGDYVIAHEAVSESQASRVTDTSRLRQRRTGLASATRAPPRFAAEHSCSSARRRRFSTAISATT